MTTFYSRDDLTNIKQESEKEVFLTKKKEELQRVEKSNINSIKHGLFNQQNKDPNIESVGKYTTYGGIQKINFYSSESHRDDER